MNKQPRIRITVNLPEMLAGRIAQLAAEDRRSRPGMIEYLVKRGLEAFAEDRQIIAGMDRAAQAGRQRRILEFRR